MQEQDSRELSEAETESGNRLLKKVIGGAAIVGAGTVFALETRLSGIGSAIFLTIGELCYIDFFNHFIDRGR